MSTASRPSLKRKASRQTTPPEEAKRLRPDPPAPSSSSETLADQVMHDSEPHSDHASSAPATPRPPPQRFYEHDASIPVVPLCWNMALGRLAGLGSAEERAATLHTWTAAERARLAVLAAEVAEGRASWAVWEQEAEDINARIARMRAELAGLRAWTTVECGGETGWVVE